MRGIFLMHGRDLVQVEHAAGRRAAQGGKKSDGPVGRHVISPKALGAVMHQTGLRIAFAAAEKLNVSSGFPG
jgi:hypothetical protein